MRQKTTSQKHAELKALSKQVKDSHYERIKLTDEILKDAEYVDKFGSEVKLVEIMEAEEWSDFATRPGLWALLRAYRENPDKDKWAEYHYDWGAMLELAREPKEEASGDRTNWKKKCEELQLRIAELEAETRLLKDLLRERLDGVGAK